MPTRIALLKVRRNKEFVRRRIVLDPQHIGLAADLAIFDVNLPASCGFVHCGRIPLSTARTLETCLHNAKVQWKTVHSAATLTIATVVASVKFRVMRVCVAQVARNGSRRLPHSAGMLFSVGFAVSTL
jgi:hypothetical protein